MGDIGGFSFDMDPDVVKDLASAEYIMPDGTLIVSDRSAPHRHGAIGHNVGYGFFEDAVNAVQRDWWEEEAHSLIEYEWGDEEEFGEFDSDSERYREIGQDILGHIENDDDWTAKIARKCVEMFLEQSGAIRHATVVDEGSSYYYSPKYCDADFECGPKGMTRAQAIVIVKHVNRMLKDGCDSVSFIVEGPTFDLIQDRYLSKPLNVDWLLKETGTIEQQCECIEGYEPCCPPQPIVNTSQGVCSYCGEVYREGTLPASHGICRKPECLQKMADDTGLSVEVLEGILEKR